MLYLLTILLGNFDHYLFKSFYIFLISFFSNTFSAISGGGAGLIQLPALILSGVPYYQALASHKLATVALGCLLYTSPSPRDYGTSRMPSSA